MDAQDDDPMVAIAEQVTYCFSERGYAFVEDDKVQALADALRSFLEAEGIVVDREPNRSAGGGD
ncbi:hypothetical protein [Krasilnikovia sp. MM14-A1259]|uniref:hypothetical protein n=1 Tax=Krasilnikovia sp. MM14-A1259 TaxID=3373539 RepID=UPI00380C41E5